jgi:hypothetical protein
MCFGHHCALGITEAGGCLDCPEADIQLLGLMPSACMARMRNSTHNALIHQNRCKEEARELLRVC